MVENIIYLVNMLDSSEGKNDVFFEVVQHIKTQIDEIEHA